MQLATTGYVLPVIHLLGMRISNDDHDKELSYAEPYVPRCEGRRTKVKKITSFFAFSIISDDGYIRLGFNIFILPRANQSE